MLAIERKLRAVFPKDNLYKKDVSGKQVLRFNQPVFSDEYVSQYHAGLNGMVQKQLRMAVSNLSNFWHTAWVNGGKPNLNSMDDPDLTKQNRKNFRREMKSWQKGKVQNLKTVQE